MNYLQTLLENLRKEVSYQWRVQSKTKDKTKVICSAYIDARDVMNVLDKYCEYGWHTEVKEIAGFIFYGIGINVPLVPPTGEDEDFEMTLHTMWRWDTGARIENDPTDQMFEQAGKSAASDAFKRAAVQWGVGRFLYDLPTVTLPCDQHGNAVDGAGNRIWDLTKHINEGKQKSKESSLPKVATPEPKGKPKLAPEAYDNMVKYIADGKTADVEKAMNKYELSPSQKAVLTSLINQEKSKKVTSSAKKK